MLKSTIKITYIHKRVHVIGLSSPFCPLAILFYPLPSPFYFPSVPSILLFPLPLPISPSVPLSPPYSFLYPLLSPSIPSVPIFIPLVWPLMFSFCPPSLSMLQELCIKRYNSQLARVHVEHHLYLLMRSVPGLEDFTPSSLVASEYSH